MYKIHRIQKRKAYMQTGAKVPTHLELGSNFRVYMDSS